MPIVTRLRGLGRASRRRALWGGLTGALLVASALALGQAGSVEERMLREATASGVSLVANTLVPELTAADAAGPVTGDRYRELATVVEQGVRADGTVRAVLVWAADGTILFASDASLVGDEVRSMRPTILGVLGGEPVTDIDRGRLRTLIPVPLAPGTSVVVELDRDGGPVAAAVDPWRLLALVSGVAALLSGLVLARQVARTPARPEGFDEDVLRSAIVARRRAERERDEAAARADHLATELERARAELREAQQRARAASRDADDGARLREHLQLAAEDVKRLEQERDALRERLAEAGRAVEAEAARAREELAAALAEIQRLEALRDGLQDRAAKAEARVAELTKELAELRARPDIEAELAAARREAEVLAGDLAAMRRRAEEAERRNAELEETARELGARVRELEGRPDHSAKLEAATSALDIAREQIRALTARLEASEGAEQEVERARREAAEARAREEEAQAARHRAELVAARALERAERAETLLAEIEAELDRLQLLPHLRGGEGATDPAVRPPDEPPSGQASSEALAPRPAPTVELAGGNGRPVALDTLVHEVADGWSARDRAVTVYAERVDLGAPEGALREIVEGLLERAGARTPSGARIVVHVERADGGALVSVEDGRSPTDDAIDDRTRRLVDDLGGWAAVERHPGGGAIARVFLPDPPRAEARSA
ncbi:MAG: hypothetical protein KatS3mg014_0866 [Actinomycetota bacterium]|nr:MAG: hypothetical protein KatS3mg014_0866 [Actinomycetota bacterium]